MKPQMTYLLQSVNWFLQSANAGLSGMVHNPVISCLIASAIGAFQLYLHNIGVKMPAPGQQGGQ